MSAGIWSFLQAKLGLQTFGVQSDSRQQGLIGNDTGAFEALITEYTENEDNGQEGIVNANPKDDAQVLTLRSGGTSSFNDVKFIADDVECSEAKPADNVAWQNLFADTKRVTPPMRKAIDFTPQNDFDEGVAVVYDEPEIGTQPRVNTEFAQQPEVKSDIPAMEQPDFAAPKADVNQPEVSHMPSSQPNMAESVKAEDHSVRQEQPKSKLPNNEPESQELPLNESPKNDNPQPIARDSRPTITESPKADAPNIELEVQEFPIDESTKLDIPKPVAENSKPIIPESPKNEPQKHDAPQPVTQDSKPTITESPNTDALNIEPEVQELPIDESTKLDIPKPVAENSKPIILESPKNEPQKPDAPQSVTQDSKPVIQESPKTDIPNTEPKLREFPVDEAPKPVIPESPKTDAPEYPEPETVPENFEAPQARSNTPQPHAFTDTDDVPVDDSVPDTETVQIAPERGTVRTNIFADVKPAEESTEDQPQPAKNDVTPEIPRADRQEIPAPSEPHDVKVPEHIETPEVPAENVKPEITPDIPSPEVQSELEMPDAPEFTPKTEAIQRDSNDTQAITKLETPHVQETEDAEAPKVPEITKPSENHEPSRTSPRVTRQRAAGVETRNVPEVPESEPEAVVTRKETPEVPARENIQPEIMSVPAKSAAHEIPASDPAPRITPENDANNYGISAFDEHEDSEIPKAAPEIPDADFVMAGLAQFQPAQNVQPETPRTVNHEEEPEISPSAANVIAPEVQPEIKDASSAPRTERPSRTQPQSARRTQAAAQEVRTNTQPQGTEFSRTTNQPGHEDAAQSRTPQPSQSASNESGNDDMPSTERVPVSNARASRSTSRTDSRTEPRTDTRRNEALSDFQSFFDSVTRVKRTASRVNTRPLSLRTGTYEVSGTQSQGRTLRNGIVNVVRFIRSEGVRKANIVVDPPALGRITVELTSGASGVEASVKVASEQIRQIIQNQLTQLRDNLLQQGVQVSEFTVDVQQDNSGQGRNSGNENQRSAYSFTASDDDDETENFRADIEEGLLYWIA